MSVLHGPGKDGLGRAYADGTALAVQLESAVLPWRLRFLTGGRRRAG